MIAEYYDFIGNALKSQTQANRMNNHRSFREIPIIRVRKKTVPK
jgi:hypothetical protein